MAAFLAFKNTQLLIMMNMIKFADADN